MALVVTSPKLYDFSLTDPNPILKHNGPRIPVEKVHTHITEMCVTMSHPSATEEQKKTAEIFINRFNNFFNDKQLLDKSFKKRFYPTNLKSLEEKLAFNAVKYSDERRYQYGLIQKKFDSEYFPALHRYALQPNHINLVNTLIQIQKDIVIYFDSVPDWFVEKMKEFFKINPKINTILNALVLERWHSGVIKTQQEYDKCCEAAIILNLFQETFDPPESLPMDETEDQL